ncbi:protein tyrosine phosphatase family protein [Acidihalobacter ferrooxydans]|uniref:Phosphatase n=1 Tax=Acidihalobacter ferrooxydans TaxID=1765967 RepID=A0A1P8UES7_9GAMM|nr:protein tyrosine phosphatase family protein [Acidihalobacter ferrooxydans]APZ42316.1 hypothetical protein BW247_03780 [Acidihalobacter ferrooxydans]
MHTTSAIESILNVRHIGPDLLLGGQPSEDELRAVAAAGYTHVVNLALLDPAYCLPDEAGLAAALGLHYRHIPVDFDAPQLADLDAFATAAEAADRLFLHCAMNYRATAFATLWLERDRGWPRAQADALIADVWEPYGAWPAFISRARREWFSR